ncbi:MAG: bi-domain-containing oxidoreductase [Ignavibacteria bacterium]|nr:bi-domain-containing oxidoreductase [Ignavibacteria bacterium]
MKQIIQYQKTGEMKVDELPVPQLKDGYVLVENYFSLISSGTERTSVETAKASMMGKARSRPDLVKQVIESAKKEGLKATWDKVQNRLDNYKELGYSCAGIVRDSACSEFKPGDRVACAGAAANHSEFVLVPKNLTARVPDNVSFEDAAFTTLGAIAMQGVRQADLRLGEKVAVIGLGLLGIITVQLLKASGCKVIGLDINDNNFQIAETLGCDLTALCNEESVKLVESFTDGYGTDAVIITASSKSNEPVEQALQFARRKSNIVVVGAVGMNLPRSPFYEKEINLKISCSYGPGRYDREYEEYGIDYPFEYVRWTEKRNMLSVLELLSENKISFTPLVSHKFNIRDGLLAYDLITGKTDEKYLAVLLDYGKGKNDDKSNIIIKEKTTFKTTDLLKTNIGLKVENIVAGFIGAGNFAQSYLLPVLKSRNIRLKTVVTSKPVNASSVKDKFGFEFCGTNADMIFDDKEINTVFVASRHDSHGNYAIRALKSGKHLFIEKPLAISEADIETIKELYPDTGLNLFVGFNRRFSKSFKDIKKFFDNSKEPKIITYRVHAGFISSSHWIQDSNQGGRITGEGCHFIDTMQYLTDSIPVSFYAASIRSTNSATNNSDNACIVINFADGSVGNLLYLSNGDSSVGKEYCEVFSGGKTAVMNNFSENIYFENGKRTSKKYDGKKGHKEELLHFISVLEGKEKPSLNFNSLILTSGLAVMIQKSL